MAYDKERCTIIAEHRNEEEARYHTPFQVLTAEEALVAIKAISAILRTTAAQPQVEEPRN